jgi:hypothetical protein
MRYPAISRGAFLITAAFALVFMTGVLRAEQAPAPAPAPKADITGQWASKFDSQVGEQTYTYDFVAAKDGTLTGKIKGSLAEGPVDVQEGKVEGDKVSFVENLNFQGMEIRIVYTGTITSADEIKFTRNVMDFATEEVVATRVKK